VLLGCVIHVVFTLSIAYYVIVRKNPYKFAYGMVEAILTMIGTCSR